jgi:hypothetical protein
MNSASGENVESAYGGCNKRAFAYTTYCVLLLTIYKKNVKHPVYYHDTQH